MIESRPAETSLAPGPAAVLLELHWTIPQTGRALAVACGDGSDPVWLAERGLQVVAVDGSAGALDGARSLAERRGVGARLFTAEYDFERGLPKFERPFEVVVCVRLHMPWLWQGLREAVAPGGILVMEAPAKVAVESTHTGEPAGPALIHAAGSLHILRYEAVSEIGRPTVRLVARRPR